MNDPVINILLASENNLGSIVQHAAAKWTTRVKGGLRHYENAIYTAGDKQTGEEVLVVVGRWSDNPDWDVRLRIDFSSMVDMDVENGLIAYRPGRHGFITVTNGYQQIVDIETGIPQNQPKILREFAERVLAWIF
jgi:hypothetical protein